MPEIKALHPDAARLKSARQLAIKPISLRPGCLVLDRDMRLPLSRVLRTKPVAKPSSQLGPDRFQGWAFNGKGNARPKMANTCDICQDRGLALGDGPKVVRDLFRVLPRQPVKHRQMRSKEVSLRREMRLSQEVKCLEIGSGNPGGEDQRMTRLQLNSALVFREARDCIEASPWRRKGLPPFCCQSSCCVCLSQAHHAKFTKDNVTKHRVTAAEPEKRGGALSCFSTCNLHPVSAGVLGLVECHVSFPVGFCKV